MLTPYNLKPLPPQSEIESVEVLKQLAKSHRQLGVLDGIVKTIPNESILISTLTLQEAKDSSAIESIITTHDELYKSDYENNIFENQAAKEVHKYSQALQEGYAQIKNSGILTSNTIVTIQEILEGNNAGIRKQSGTKLMNEATNEVVYIPPQEYTEILKLMDNLVNYINYDELHDVDPLIKMAVIHYQFESIHPFYDGNGRTGRIINILYFVLKGLLNLPILYLSRYIIRTKDEYYKRLQNVREQNQWEEWVLYLLKGVETTAEETVILVKEIKNLMMSYKHTIRKELPKIYSQDLINNLFKHPYTKIDYLVKDLNIVRITATKYLNELTELGLLEKVKYGRTIFYINTKLFKLFIDLPDKR